MPHIYLIRHGMAAATWGEHRDPGLSDLGRDQAARIAAELRRIGPLPIVTSPLLRARETATAFEKVWGIEARIDPRISELPCSVTDPAERHDWLKVFARSDWTDTEPAVQDWRDQLIAYIASLSEDTVLTTHFVAINAIIGHALRQTATLYFHPDHASCTQLALSGRTIRILKLGADGSSTLGFHV